MFIEITNKFGTKYYFNVEDIKVIIKDADNNSRVFLGDNLYLNSIPEEDINLIIGYKMSIERDKKIEEIIN